MKRVCIITPYHMNPPAYRVTKEKEFLMEMGISVEILHPPKGLGIIARNLYLYKKFKKSVKNFDLFIVYDLLTLIFLSKVLYKYKHKVVYEVLDSFPEYYTYKMLKNFPLLSGLLQSSLRFTEFLLSKYIVSKIIVNSEALYVRIRRYNDNIFWIPYTSPFEKLNFFNDPQKPVAFVYLGLFSEEKGASEILRFSYNHLHYPVFVIGENQCSIRNIPKNLILYEKMHFEKLGKFLLNLSKQYFLYGFSLINAKNRSYAIQEANKDIDYLSLGIPIIGNRRPPTYKKIKYGAGILIEEVDKYYNINDSFLKKELSQNAKRLYELFYSSSKVKEQFKRCFW